MTGPKAVTLTPGRVLTDIDAILYCIGYNSHIPLKLEPAEPNPYPVEGQAGALYRNMFPLHPDP